MPFFIYIFSHHISPKSVNPPREWFVPHETDEN